MLKENLKAIAPEVFTAIREFLKGRQASESTEFFVENFCQGRPDAIPISPPPASP